LISKRPIINLSISIIIASSFLFPLSITSADYHQEVTASTRFVANTGTDSGTCDSFASPCRTIQYAVNQSSSGDVIKVAQGTYSYNGTTEQCSFLSTRAVVCVKDKSLTILGGFSTSNWYDMLPVVNLTSIDGGGAYRGVAVYKTANTPTPITFLDLEGFTIRNCRVSGNSAASGEAIGGGMYVHQASVTLRDLVFHDNQALASNNSSGSGGNADGSAIRFECFQDVCKFYSSLIQRVTFTGNQTISGTGPERGGIAKGAVYIYQTTVVIEDSILSGNIAEAADSGGDGYDAYLHADAIGGGIAVMNGSPGWIGSLTLNRVSVIGNEARGGGASSSSGTGGGAFGGGIFVEGMNGTLASLTMTDGLIKNNTATAGDAKIGGPAAGGGVDCDTCQLSINKTEFINNTAQGGSSASGSTAGSASGGGVMLFPKIVGVPRASIINSIFSENFAKQGLTGTKSVGSGGGGGMTIGGVGADITHTTFDRNGLSSDYVVGQALVVQQWNGIPANVTLYDSIISNHTIGAIGAAAIVVASNSTLTLDRGLFSGNTNNLDEYDTGVANDEANMSVAPTAGFMSPGSPDYNYHLRLNSPAKDMTAGSATSIDYDGQARPYNTISDFGADEYWTFALFAGIGDGALYLDWTQQSDYLSGAVNSYEIVVTCAPTDAPDQGSCGEPIGVGSVTHFTLTGLSNFVSYMLIVYAKDGSDRIASSASITVMPTDLLMYLPYTSR
jgi:hypothetical protein